MVVAAPDWLDYVREVRITMSDFLEGKINMSTSFDQVDSAFARFSRTVDDDSIKYYQDINQDVLNVISEIDGDNSGYREVLALLKKDPTPDQYRQFIDLPI